MARNIPSRGDTSPRTKPPPPMPRREEPKPVSLGPKAVKTDPSYDHDA
jgi:hypothetical protein